MVSIDTLEESLSITTGRCDLAIATHARKMHKKYQYDSQLSILVSQYPKPPGGQPQRDFYAFS
jgi:hypothetical protein